MLVQSLAMFLLVQLPSPHFELNLKKKAPQLFFNDLESLYIYSTD